MATFSKTQIFWCLAIITGALNLLPASAQSPSDKMQLVLVVGAAGSEEYGEQFRQWTEQWKQVAEKANFNLTLIGPVADVSTASPAGSDRELLETVLRQQAVSSDTALWIVLIGHGTFAGDVAKFNLRGPDVSATEITAWLENADRPVVLVNCASASAPFLNRLSGPNRVVVTATKSGTEQNFARFGKYFAAAIASPESDLDHDQEVSVLEAFLRASAEVRKWYESEARIRTENALIDDNADGRGTPATMFRGVRPVGKAKDGTELDGRLASRITIALDDEPLLLTAEQLQQRDQLETQLQALRDKKDSLSEQQYFQELEPLLVQLAKIYQAAAESDR